MIGKHQPIKAKQQRKICKQQQIKGHNNGKQQKPKHKRKHKHIKV